MNIDNKSTGSTYSASEWNEFKNELENFIESSSQTLASTSLQVEQAVARYVANASSYTDSGIADAYSLVGIGLNDVISSYIDGATVIFKAGNANTGSSTITISGLTAKTIKKNGFADVLVSGDIIANKVYSAYYSLADDAFELEVGGSSAAGFGANENLQSGAYSLLSTDYGDSNDVKVVYTGSGGEAFTHLSSASLTAGSSYVVIEHRGTGILEVDFALAADRLGTLSLGRTNIFLSPGEVMRFLLTGTANVWSGQ